MASPSPSPPADAPMGGSVANSGWETTPFVPKEDWPPSLAVAADLTLRSR